jgi:NIMA (never in mitosis gene a)-related kinase
MKEIELDDVGANEAIDIAQEATTLATLSHPNIIKYYDSFREGECFYIITEYCEVNENLN